MDSFHVLVNAPGTSICRYLRASLPRSRFEVVEIESVIEFHEDVRRLRPEFAVIGGLAERPRTALLEILEVRAARPDVVVVAVDTAPPTPLSEAAGRAASFFVDGSNLGRPVGPELVSLILSAADEFARDKAA